jgi:DNA repair protein RecN (Recombination protein N)
MLRFLSIRHLAVIETLEVEFGPGLNVLTGETGAGKSVLVEAIELLLGTRAAADLVRTGADTAVVQAVMDTPRNEEVILRREVSSSGRSRAFIDGNLVTSSQLRDLTGPLIDLHGQHEHQALLAPHQHLSLLDVYAALDPAQVEATAAAFEAYRRTRAALEACQLDERERVARLERLQFQLGQIEKVNPRPDEDEELSAERHRLANVDRLLQLATDGYQLLYEGDGSVLDRLSTVWKRVGELATLDPAAQPYLEARDPIRSQLEDLALYLRGYIVDLEASPDRLQFVEDRLALLERLKRSYGPTLGDVIGRRAALEAEVEALTGAEGRAATLGVELEARRAAFLQHATVLSSARHTAAATLQADLANVLGELAMPHAVLDVRFPASPLPEGQWSASGIDTAEFFLSANPGEAPRPLARVASGGELSRIMLGLKSLATVDRPGKTLVFDEVDAGIGGRVADAVGKRLRALGTRFQVLCITHLPQVAAYGHSHYRVTKSVERSRALTRVERLDQPARVGELARMIGGERVTEAVLAGAAEMLAARDESKETTKGESESRRGRSRR